MGEKTLLPYQQRVIEERDELVFKAVKLKAFIDNKKLLYSLKLGDQWLLFLQVYYMYKYKNILDKRIKRF